MNNGAKFLKTCPNCHSLIGFSSNQKTIRCHCCDKEYSFEQLSIIPDDLEDKHNKISKNINTLDSALAFLDNYFNNFDWDEYASNNPVLLVADLNSIVEKMKNLFPNFYDTWQLEFKSIAIPLNKRLEIIDSEINNLDSLSLDLQSDKAKESFDSYYLNTFIILKNKDFIFRTLELDLHNLSKFAKDQKQVKPFEEEFNKFKTRMASLKLVESVYELNFVKSKLDKKHEQFVKEYSKQKINVEETYQEAIKNYLSCKRNDALTLFNKIPEYKDSKHYINKLESTNLSFNSQIIEVAGSNFLLEKNHGSKNKVEKNFKDSSSSKYPGSESFSCSKLYELQPIADGLKVGRPTLQNIAKILTSCGDNIFYINNANSLCCFDIAKDNNLKITSLIGCKAGEHSLFVFNDIAKIVFLTAKEREQKNNFFDKVKAKILNKNSLDFPRFTLSIVDTTNNQLSFENDDILDIVDRFDKTIFYSKGVFDEQGQLIDKKYCLYNIETREHIFTFDHEVLLYGISGDYLLYGEWQFNNYNIDLYSYNLRTKQTILLEKNSFGALQINNSGVKTPIIIDNFVYYKVGNYRSSLVYRIKLDGSEKSEIIRDIDSIDLVTKNDFFITINDTFVTNKGGGSTKTLIKSSIDGSKRTFICSGIKYIVLIKHGYVYYVDTFENLHVVKMNGEDDKILISNFEKDLIVNNSKIYFTASEFVGEYNGMNNIDEGGKSIYSINIDGSNLCKVAFNVKQAEKYDDKTIYFSTEEVLVFNVQDLLGGQPVGKPKSKRYLVETFYALNIETMSLTRIYYKNYPKLNVRKPGDKPSKRAKKVEVTPALHHYNKPIKEARSFVDKSLEQQKLFPFSIKKTTKRSEK